MNVSYWMKNKKNTISYPALEKECDCDVLIIGGGISGISTAYYLAETGNDVILLEADCIGYGASGRNTGKVSAQHGIVYHELIEKHGIMKAIKKRLMRLNNWLLRTILIVISSDVTLFYIQKKNSKCLFIRKNMKHMKPCIFLLPI